MSKEIWLSPVLGNNRDRLLARCAEYLARGQAGRLLYIAASHPLLDLVSEKLLDGDETRGVWGEFPVYLFRGFVRRLLSGAVVSEARPLGRAGVDGEPLLTRGLLTRSVDDEPLLTRGLLTRSVDGEPLLTRGLLTRSVDGEAGVPLTLRVAIDREELPLRRSLISQIIKQLSAAGKLKAIRPLANRDGCVNTIASLIGELQRAGKTPAEFQQVVDEREAETATETQRHRAGPKVRAQKFDQPSAPRSQADFDREVALVYSTYVAALDRFQLTDADADQLRALQVLSGETDGRRVSSPWLESVELLVLDGFFDFTPVQGEMLRRLIPAIPNVIVNLNHDERNPEIFAPFQTTIDQFKSFEIKTSKEAAEVSPALRPLRQRLFGSGGTEPRASAPGAGTAVTLLDCSDRETEIRSIAKEIKGLILEQGYQLSDIALVVRERASYAETILRVCADQSIPCNLERRVEATHIPALRACAKLFQLLKEPVPEKFKNPKCSDIAHLIKTGYFRVSHEDLATLTATFEVRFQALWEAEQKERQSGFRGLDANTRERLRVRFGVGRWVPDILENVIAYVGSELPMSNWRERAHRLINVLPSPEAARSFIGVGGDGDDPAAAAEQEVLAEDGPVKEKRKRPTPVHPLAIAWTILVLEHLQRLVASLPPEGEPEKLRTVVMGLLDHLEFSDQVRRPFRASMPSDVAQATLDIRGLESLRRSLAATVRSFKQAAEIVTAAKRPPSITLASFIDEVERSLAAQVLSVGAGNRDGLRVLEATDVRGLRFRAVFIAGMIEGGFPLRSGRDWLYPHEERERLKQYGVVLEDISIDTLLKEEHYFYQAACRATERLYLTRPQALGDGSETVVSYYLEELRRAIAPAEIETRLIRGDVDTQDPAMASTPSELATLLVRNEEQRRHQGSDAGRLLERARSLDCLSESALRRIDIERERAGPSFGRFDGEITNGELRAILRQYFGPERVHSASGLGTYGNCPFRFFAARVLRLEPRNEAAMDLQAIDAGKLLHDVLRRFFEQHRRQYLPSLNRQTLLQEMNQAADEVFRRHQEMVPPLNQRIWQIDCEIRKLMLEQLLISELRLQEQGEHEVLPTYFELGFGNPYEAGDPASSTENLKLARPAGGPTEAALIQGRIDRVDVSKRDKTAIAYDYKLTKGAPLEDIRAGRDVQIAIYLTALEELILKDLELAGGGYYIIKPKGGRRNQGLYRKTHSNYTGIGSTVKANCDDAEWRSIRAQVRARVWQFIDGMRAGKFLVDPSLGRKTCKFCDYSAACRYDSYRISHKHSQ